MNTPHKEVLLRVAMAKFQIMNQGLQQLQEEIVQFPAHYQIPRDHPAGMMIAAVNERVTNILNQAASVTPQNLGVATSPLPADTPAIPPEPEQDIDDLLG